MMNQTKFVNPHFDLIRLWLQEHIGQFIAGLLILTYLATGFIIGMALQKSYLPWVGPTLSWVGGMAVAILAQAARGSLVYFSQANPYRLNGHAHLIGSLAALALTVFSCYEIYGLMSEGNVTTGGIVSAIGLIIAGFLVEVFFLKELVKMNQAAIASSPDLFKQVVEQEEKLSEIKISISEAKVKLLQHRRDRLTAALQQSQPTTLPKQEEQKETIEEKIIEQEDKPNYQVLIEELKKQVQELQDKKEKTSTPLNGHKAVIDVPLDLAANGQSLNGNGHH